MVRCPGLGCVHVVGFPIFRGAVGRVRVCGLVSLCGVPASGFRVLFENCIVDASIFDSFCLGFFGDKLLRAIGGCLGIKSR